MIKADEESRSEKSCISLQKLLAIEKKVFCQED